MLFSHMILGSANYQGNYDHAAMASALEKVDFANESTLRSKTEPPYYFR